MTIGKYAKIEDDAPAAKKDAGDETLAKVSKGLRVARAAIEESEGTSIAGLIGGTDLPALSGSDPLGDLLARLDREADLWRNLAFREMTRVTTQGRIITALVLLATLADLALAAVASMSAIVGFDSAPQLALLFTSFAVVNVGLGASALVLFFARRAQRDLVRAALARADLAELRLHRVALVLTAKQVDEARFLEALTRLERDAS